MPTILATTHPVPPHSVLPYFFTALRSVELCLASINLRFSRARCSRALTVPTSTLSALAISGSESCSYVARTKASRCNGGNAGNAATAADTICCRSDASPSNSGAMKLSSRIGLQRRSVLQCQIRFRAIARRSVRCVPREGFNFARPRNSVKNTSCKISSADDRELLILQANR